MSHNPVNSLDNSVNNFGSWGILTAADSNIFESLKLLVRSLHEINYIPLACADLGLTEDQCNWLIKHHVHLIDDPVPPHVFKTLTGPASIAGPPDLPERERLIWKKPWLIAVSPFIYTLWLDADTVVLDDLIPLFTSVQDKGVQVFIDAESELSRNPPNLYELFPPSTDAPELPINSGVVGLCLDRDAELIYAWRYLIEQVIHDRHLRHNNVTFSDQGALIWALRDYGVRSTGHANRWNRVANGLGEANRDQRNRYKDDNRLFERIAADHPGSAIVHWTSKPKLPDLLDP